MPNKIVQAREHSKFSVKYLIVRVQKITGITIVLTQIVAIDAKIGNSYKEPHHAMMRILVQGLLDLGIMQGDLEEIIAGKLPSVLYARCMKYWLGMDVHDKSRQL